MKSVPQRGSVWLVENRFTRSGATRYRAVVLTSSPLGCGHAALRSQRLLMTYFEMT